MKIPISIFESLPVVFLEIIKNKKAPDRALEFEFKKHKKWGSRDRRFFAETIYDCIRHFRKYWVLSGLNQNLNHKQIQIEDIKKVLKTYFRDHSPDLIVPYIIETQPFAGELRHIEETSYSNWFYELGASELGDMWRPVAEDLNRPPPVFLRTNTLKIDRLKLQSLLLSEGHETEVVEGSAVALRLINRKSLSSTKAFQSGLFEIQDLSSQKVAELLNPQVGEQIVDACAGGGGKTLHLACLSKNKSSILAMDIYHAKLVRLLTRAERAGASSIRAQTIESAKIIQKLENHADALLLDVPCSGSGVIRRHPETKWQFQQEDWLKIQKTQDQILHDYCKIVKPGGRMIFSTCSIFPSENEKKLHQFLSSHSDWSLESKQTLYPMENQGDGFFMARLNKASR